MNMCLLVLLRLFMQTSSNRWRRHILGPVRSVHNLSRCPPLCPVFAIADSLCSICCLIVDGTSCRPVGPNIDVVRYFERLRFETDGLLSTDYFCEFVHFFSYGRVDILLRIFFCCFVL
jgi:hypothetical protein